MKNFIFLFALAIFPQLLKAESFTYNYRGVDFVCKVKNGTTIIKYFDVNIPKVVIPANVVNPATRREYQVNKIDLNGEALIYKTNIIVIEKGISEIEDRCFYNFRQLSKFYMPSSINRIGRKAFHPNYLPAFTMPSTISERDLAAGLAVHPNIEKNIVDEIDISEYFDNPTPDQNPKKSQTTKPAVTKVEPGKSDVDYNIPTTNESRENTFCIIIANENYQKSNTPEVAYAATDGETFRKYCMNTLGIPRENIKMAINATYLEMQDIFAWLNNVAEAYGTDANFIVYYAGHGVPDEEGACYLLPTDGDISKPGTNGYSLKKLYTSLGKITTKSALVLIDACFSGNDRNDVSMLDGTERGFTREIKNEAVSGNVVVLTAASNTETALSYNDKGHGMFSYFLMKKIQETKGKVTYGELYDYIHEKVYRRSSVVSNKKQTPSVSYSDNIKNTWRNLNF